MYSAFKGKKNTCFRRSIKHYAFSVQQLEVKKNKQSLREIYKAKGKSN